MRLLFKQRELYCYISEKAGYDPVKTIYVCAPGCAASTYETAKCFAETSGWKAIAQADGAVLVLPVVPGGWRAEKADFLKEIYQETKACFPTQSGKSLYGRNGFLWCWETLLYAVGYEDGAAFLGNTVVAHPNFLAAAALVNGVPKNYAPAEQPSSHWLTKNVSEDHRVCNRDIPVCLWLFAPRAQSTEAAMCYFNQSNGTVHEGQTVTLGQIPALRYQNTAHKAQQVCVSTGQFLPEPALAKTIFEQWFERVIRWKNGPDGKLTPFMSRADFYQSKRFIRDAVSLEGREYGYFIHLPATLTRQQAQGLPLVFSVHGRGEPAWMFAEKNGWDKLADETKEFILVVPDSPENIWFLERDGAVFAQIIEKMHAAYGIDKTRVYLTGFSNGGMITREVGTKYPQLFAAVSPWNAPLANTCPDFAQSGYELPCFIYVGDNDPLTQNNGDTLLGEMLAANHCAAPKAKAQPVPFCADAVYDGQNHYTQARGYQEGDRLRAFVYLDASQRPRVCLTILKNMPHGAIHDESRAAWEFLKQYKRPQNSKTVVGAAPAEGRKEK